MSSLNLGQLSIGLGIGYSSILIPQLNAETSQVSVTSTKIEIGISETSWIVSLVSIGQIGGAILGAFLASAIGRKGEGHFTFHQIFDTYHTFYFSNSFPPQTAIKNGTVLYIYQASSCYSSTILVNSFQ